MNLILVGVGLCRKCQLKGLCVEAEWYVLGKRYSTHCSKSDVGSIRYSCMLNPDLCNLVDYFVNKS